MYVYKYMLCLLLKVSYMYLIQKRFKISHQKHNFYAFHFLFSFPPPSLSPPLSLPPLSHLSLPPPSLPPLSPSPLSPSLSLSLPRLSDQGCPFPVLHAMSSLALYYSSLVSILCSVKGAATGSRTPSNALIVMLELAQGELY